MTVKDFIELLKNHDWGYRRSDDTSVFKRGQSSERNIDHIIKENPELEKVYKNYRFERFGW